MVQNPKFSSSCRFSFEAWETQGLNPLPTFPVTQLVRHGSEPAPATGTRIAAVLRDIRAVFLSHWRSGARVYGRYALALTFKGRRRDKERERERELGRRLAGDGAPERASLRPAGQP